MCSMARKAKRPRSEFDYTPNQRSDDKGVRFLEECAAANPTVNIQEDEEEEEILLSEGYSSSYSGSMCGSYDDVNGDEAQSVLRRDSSLPQIDEVLCMNKKEPSDIWKQHILTIFWRCKWLEIKTKEMASQARYYDQEARRCDETKESDVEGTSSSRSGNETRRFYGRKRRKRVEATKDIAAYRAKHHIFSYTDKRRVGARKVPILDFDYDPSQQVRDYKEESDIESRFPALFAQDPLEKILHKIYKAQEKATKLKNIVNRFISEPKNEQCEEEEEEEEPLIPTPPKHTEEDQPRNQTQKDMQMLSRCSMFPVFSIEDMLNDETEMIVEGTEAEEEMFNLLMVGLDRFTVVPEEDDET